MRIFYDKAKKFDLQGNTKQAIEYYLLSIQNDEEIVDAYLNLIVILIEINLDYGKSSDLIAKNDFSENEIQGLCSLLKSLLDQSINKFISTNEFIFWKYYYDNFYMDFNREGLLDVIKKNKDCLVPYFQLYINDLINNLPLNYYKSKIMMLKKIIMENTHKNLYIKSLIDSTEFQIALK